MKIGVSTLALYPEKLDNVLGYLEELKVDFCEIINEYPYHQVGSDDLESFNIQATIHAPLSDINLASPNQAIQKASIMQVKRSMDLARSLDAEVVVVHPGQMPILSRGLEEAVLRYNQDSLAECAAYAFDCGVSMCVENMPRINGLLFQDLAELHQLVQDLDVHITLDVGHAHNNSIPPAEMLKSSRVKHVHLSDNDGSFDHHHALGSAGIDFKSIISHLQELNYRGILVVEVKESADIKPSLSYLQGLL
ncbi:MAG: sugar phosphate isomerase/epimerase [Euryarchaeota archaeon]|jgi:sugar phosphate isomerase/epimerase|nr:sugar phosphate isomerase/epimerase [Euryarchaeota archaeon]